MPAKWQQWMPFKIDAFKGSPAVQAMHPCARIGYLYLLACAWQSEDCTIPDDNLALSEMSGLGIKLWKIHGDQILRKFTPNGQKRLLNHVLAFEWQDARRVFESRKSAAQRTNTARWLNGDRTVTDSGPNRSADTRTGTLTGTVQEQKPSPQPRKRSAEPKHSTDPRHVACKAEIFAYYQRMNKGEEPEWDGHEGKTLAMFLKSNPKLTDQGLHRLLEHRSRSEINHSERPSLWIRKLKSFLNGPLNEYGKPLMAKKNGGYIGKGDATLEALRQCLAENPDGSGADGFAPGNETGQDDPFALFKASGTREC